MDQRQHKILQAIVETFVQTASPIGSKYIYESYDLNVSPATIRNDMAALEEAGLISQPHTSAGRIPTHSAYRMIVNNMDLNQKYMSKVKNDLLKVRQQVLLKRTKEMLYDTVSVLATVTGSVSFATIPGQDRVFYVGISKLLKNPEFATDTNQTTSVLEVIENDLYNVLKEFDIDEEGILYIGEENILPEFSSCSLMAQPYEYKGFTGVMGLLGSTRMDYPYNLASLKTAIQLLNE